MRAVALAVACVGCSSPHTGGPRDAAGDAAAAIIDAATDAVDPTDAITNRVTITVHADDGSDTPVAGAVVLAHDRAALLARRTATAGDGTASIDVPMGGSVTVIRARTMGEAGLNASTVYDLDAPIHLEFGWRPGRGAPLGAMGVAVPAYPGATSTTVFSGCDSQAANGGFAVVHLYADCQRASYDFVAIAYADDGTPLASTELDAQPFVDSAIVAIPATFTAAQPFTISVTDIPPAETPLQVTRTEVRAGLRYSASVGALIPAGARSATTTFPVAATGSDMDVQFSVRPAAFHDGGFLRDRVPATSSVTRSIAEMPGDTGTAQVTDVGIWVQQAFQPVGADGLYVRIATVRGVATVDRWLLVAKPDHSTLQIPKMPPDVTLLVFTNTNNDTFQKASAAYYGSERFADYAAFLAEADREHLLRFSDRDPSLRLYRSGDLAP